MFELFERKFYFVKENECYIKKIFIYWYMLNMRWCFVIVVLMGVINLNLKCFFFGGNICLEGIEIV